MSNRWVDFTVKELEELVNGLGWSLSEGCEHDTSVNRELDEEIEKELKNR